MWLLNIKAVIIFSQMTLISCALDPQQYALANALQSILSPANTEKALQIIQMAANRQLNAPCVEEKVAPLTEQPNRQIIPIGALQRITTPNGEQYLVKETPNREQYLVKQTTNGEQYLVQQTTNGEQHLVKQTPKLEQYIVKRSQHSQPNVPIPQNIEVIPSNVLPVQNPATIMSQFTMPNSPLIVAREIPQAPLAKEVCPCASRGLLNPFLPAASPISALSPPTSNLLPSAFPMQSRGHFLRKIPIPPPTL